MCFVCLCVFLQAQQEKLRVAVLDPTTSGIAMDDGTRLAVQELISSTFVNTGRYIIIERSMIDKIIKEQSFQNSDMADNSQATEIGKLAGANKVVLSAVSMVGGRNMLSVKIIDVTTASIDKQKTKIVSSSDLLDAVEPLTLELLGEQAEYVKQNTVFTQQETPKPAEKPKQQPKTSEKKNPEASKATDNPNFDFAKEYQEVCGQVDAGVQSAPAPYNSKVSKALAKLNVIGTFVLGGGISSTLTESGVLTVEGSGPMLPVTNNQFKAQVKYAKVIVVSEGRTGVCGFEGSKAQYVKLPSTLEVVGDECFEDCSDLLAVNIPPSVKKIGREAFNGCERLYKIVIPENVESIGSAAFEDCESLQSITLPNSVTAIPDGLFKGCKNLRDVYFFNGITSIGNSVFYGCNSIQKLVVPNSVVSIGEGCFQRMQALYDIRLSEKLTTIPKKAFADCKSLTKVTVPASVRSVGNDAFASCENLVQVFFLSENMTEFGEDCFKSCRNLGNIVLHSIRPPKCPKEGIFDGEEEYLERVTLSVHPAGFGVYKKAKFWEDFKMIATISQ